MFKPTLLWASNAYGISDRGNVGGGEGRRDQHDPCVLDIGSSSVSSVKSALS